MKVAFRETHYFTEALNDYFGSDDPYRLLQTFLDANPDFGKVIPGTGGLRKLRWLDPRRGKGKRGGLRIIYLHVPFARMIFFLDVYDKDEMDDLSISEKRGFAILAEQIREELRKERNWDI